MEEMLVLNDYDCIAIMQQMHIRSPLARKGTKAFCSTAIILIVCIEYVNNKKASVADHELRSYSVPLREDLKELYRLSRLLVFSTLFKLL